MHNKVSHNQLAGWNMTDSNLTPSLDSELNKIDDYFDCLIECADLPQACRRICKNVFD